MQGTSKQQCQLGMRLRQKPYPIDSIGGDATQVVPLWF